MPQTLEENYRQTTQEVSKALQDGGRRVTLRDRLGKRFNRTIIGICLVFIVAAAGLYLERWSAEREHIAGTAERGGTRSENARKCDEGLVADMARIGCADDCDGSGGRGFPRLPQLCGFPQFTACEESFADVLLGHLAVAGLGQRVPEDDVARPAIARAAAFEIVVSCARIISTICQPTR